MKTIYELQMAWMQTAMTTYNILLLKDFQQIYWFVLRHLQYFTTPAVFFRSCTFFLYLHLLQYIISPAWPAIFCDSCRLQVNDSYLQAVNGSQRERTPRMADYIQKILDNHTKSVHTRLGHSGSTTDPALVGPPQSACTNVLWFDLESLRRDMLRGED